jgi:hypothetical protein
MNNYRIRPKGNYIQEASWDKLYFLTKKWKEDVVFHKKDIKFFIDLVETYFAKLLMYENLDEIREIQIDLLHLHNECESTLKRIQLHLSHLSNLIIDTNRYDSHAFRNEHEKLEDKISGLIKNIKSTQKDTFVMTTDVVKNENPKIFWRYN